MAKAYLFQKKYVEAKTLLKAVVASGQYKLMDKYHDNFKAVTNNNAESIFEGQYSVNDGASGVENGNVGSTLNYPYGGGVLRPAAVSSSRRRIWSTLSKPTPPVYP